MNSPSSVRYNGEEAQSRAWYMLGKQLESYVCGRPEVCVYSGVGRYVAKTQLDLHSLSYPTITIHLVLCHQSPSVGLSPLLSFICPKIERSGYLCDSLYSSLGQDPTSTVLEAGTTMEVEEAGSAQRGSKGYSCFEQTAIVGHWES